MGLARFGLTAALTVFHGSLLWQRLTDGSLLQPVVVARWALSALLVLVLLRLWSRGLPLLSGRRAGVVWLVVALLHAMAPAAALPAVVPAVEGMLPAVLAVLAFLAIGLAGAIRLRPTAPRPAAHPRRRRPRRPGTGWYPVLFSRPPPVSLHP